MVAGVSAFRAADDGGETGVPPDVAALLPMVRRVVGARVGAHPAAEDLVQETLVRVLAAAQRVEPGMLEPYAIATARNVVATMWRDNARQLRNRHRLVDLDEPEAPEEAVIADEERSAMSEALGRLTEREQRALVAHEVAGQDTRTLAGEAGSTPGAVAAHLNRTRARLRVEYLLVLEQADPPTDLCRPVLLAVSSADRRRQRELDSGRHLLECEFCARLSQPLMGRAQQRDDAVRIPISTDADIVKARQAVREFATRAGFSGTDLTVIATAVSEVARNIVRFAEKGEILVELVTGGRRGSRGVRVVARDAGPGIRDVAQAMTDGYSTYHGLGLGLPGARRLMDDFAIVSEPGRGTTVSMTKWERKG